ncbi:sugar phosphate isomerase/epimerase family protein [Gracilibacillus alcaliphilus]|uniref:sugar phosphate isomerase/epimerase family protein n=1 Tax=Gracilibacillus alcaliphilus TaxID=1401441 RepID=UPI00195C4A94|nr:sugar phosphate isomerase/epimerase family protein [Gracilibacillus alcaliphilus]MBM7679001.1 sugar phosphate isomerase/epimerase [Gracilibacillus alcaliphilus]
MKIGCCASIEEAARLREAGFDFLEVPVTSLLGDSEEEVNQIIAKYRSSPLPIEVCNIFLPSTLKLTGLNVDDQQIDRYLKEMLPRVKAIGADTIVFGSGGARSFPEGFSKQAAEQQIIAFLKRVAGYAEPLGLTIVIEPLNREESNLINTVLEAVTVAEQVDSPAIQVLADFYHMQKEKESLTHITEAAPRLRHIHVADSGRHAPGTGTYPYQEFKQQLDKAEYTWRISVECEWQQFEVEAFQVKRFLDTIFNGMER